MYGDAYLEIVKMAVDTPQHTTSLVGSHLSTRHMETVKFQFCNVSYQSSERNARA